MSRSLHLALLVPLVITPACGKRAEPERPPGVVVPDPTGAMSADDGKVPPPRLVPPAAEPSDAEKAPLVAIVYDSKGVWRARYPQGQRIVFGGMATTDERDAVGALVLPVGRPVTLSIASETGAGHFDIAAFPLAFALEGGPWRATVKPTRTGEFGIWSGKERFGRVVVVPAEEFDAWLAGIAPLRGENPADGSLAFEGRKLFLKLQCINCHGATPDAKGPTLEGLYGAKVKLADGAAVTADEQYITESVRNPKAKVVAGWEAIMPAFDKEKLSDEELNALVAYIRSLKRGDTKPKEERPPAPVGPPK